MSGRQTQGWDFVLELNENALNRQLAVGLPGVIPSMLLGPGSTLSLGTLSGPTRTASAALSIPNIRVRFVPGRADRLSLSVTILFNGADVPYITDAEPGQIETTNADSFNGLAVLNLERADLQLDPITIRAVDPDWLMTLATAGLTEDDVHGFAGPVMDAIKRVLRSFSPPPPRALLPLSAPLSSALRLAARVITSNDPARMDERAFSFFFSERTVSPPLEDRGPIHLQGPAADRTALVVNNSFFLNRVLRPALNANPLFMPSPGLVFDGIGRLDSTVRPFRIAGTPAFLSMTALAVTINDATEAFVMTASFDILGVGIVIASGTAVMRFGVRWDNPRQTIVIGGVPATQNEPGVDVHVDLSALMYILSAIAFSLLFGAIGFVGGPVGAVIGAVVGAGFGLAAASVTSVILSIIASGPVTSTARGLVGTAFPIRLPLLAPVALQTQGVRLDDLAITARPVTPILVIEGSGLHVTRRTTVSSNGLSTLMRLTWAGDFTARATILQEPLRYFWTLGDRLLDGVGEMSLIRGSVFFSVDGSHCHLTTAHGSFLRERLCVMVQDASGFRMSSCRLLEAQGERNEIDELFIAPDIPLSFFNLPPGIIPDPPIDLSIDPEAMAQARKQYVEAIERGMGVIIPKVQI